jgi:hypothetical protein
MSNEQPTPTFEEALADLAALIIALQPFRNEVVLCGGFAAWMYRFHPEFGSPHGVHQITLDIDWAVPKSLAQHELSVAEELKRREFVPIIFRGDSPPVIKYQHKRWGNNEPAPVCVEFLTPLQGRDKGKSAEKIQSSLNAILLRYMDLALDRPVLFDVSVVPKCTLPAGTSILVPHPANYMFQKALTAPRRRKKAKMKKDLAYLYDAVLLTRPVWDRMLARISTFENQDERKKWLKKARTDLESWFEMPDAFGNAAVAEVLTAADPSNPLTPERVHRVMTHALPAIGMWPT